MDKDQLNIYKNKLISYAENEINTIIKKLNQENLVEVENIKKLFLFFSKGKFIRSFLIKKIFDYYQGRDELALYNLGLALEIFHSSILIHDDVFDNDYLRRGEKTIFYQYNCQYKKNKGDLFGKNLAIILGDLGFYLSNIFLWRAVKNHNNKSLILELFFYQVIKTALGEFLDVKSSALNKSLSVRQINLINRFKTAEYTFNLPFKIGYVLAVDKPDDNELVILEKIGYLLGDIFQIKDDFLNLVGDAKITGKSVASDIKENKNTIIKKIIFDNLPNKDKQLLMTYFGNKNLKVSDYLNFKKIFFKARVDKRIESLLISKKNQASVYINKLAIKEKSKKELINFIDYLIFRKQ